MNTAKIFAISQIKRANIEIERLKDNNETSNINILNWWEGVKIASENILKMLEYDIELEASDDFREIMMYQEYLERERPLNVQI
ncbi:putative phage protein [Clostridioides difficile CD160]|uniref:hypothetical protein n=1 Tax=unclassified Clostridioides TaxID=2635829 RepID=UPI00038CA8A8|nr:putative phage protein [Clostridioides difficile CD160]MCI9976257.1 hypothetical protein [Clostridioides difficile]